MGWGRTLLLGDIGNRMDIEDTERNTHGLRRQLSFSYQPETQNEKHAKGVCRRRSGGWNRLREGVLNDFRGSEHWVWLLSESRKIGGEVCFLWACALRTPFSLVEGKAVHGKRVVEE